MPYSAQLATVKWSPFVRYATEHVTRLKKLGYKEWRMERKSNLAWDFTIHLKGPKVGEASVLVPAALSSSVWAYVLDELAKARP